MYLTELRTDGFQPVAEVPDDRESPEDCVLTLRQVVDRSCNHDSDGYCNDPDHEEIPATTLRRTRVRHVDRSSRISRRGDLVLHRFPHAHSFSLNRLFQFAMPAKSMSAFDAAI